ncbi:hypothetical protein [Mycolicibacterium phlei]
MTALDEMLTEISTNGDRPHPIVHHSKEPERPPRERRTAALVVRMVVLTVLLTALGGAAGLLATLLTPPQYAARAEVHYDLAQSGSTGDLLREDRRLTTQLATVGSRVVLAPIAAGRGQTPEDLARDVSARVLDNSEIIEIEVRDPSPREAVRTLSKVLDRYLALANTGWQDPVRTFVNGQLREVQRQLRTLPPPNDEAFPQRAATAAALGEQERYLISLQGALEAGTAGEPPSHPPARLLVPPFAVAEPVSPSPVFTTVAGGLAGLAVATVVVLAILRIRLRG